jgi:hypothetical protein
MKRLEHYGRGSAPKSQFSMYHWQARTSEILRSYSATEKISMECYEIVRCATPIYSIVCFSAVGFASKDLQKLNNKYGISFIKKKNRSKEEIMNWLKYAQKFKKPNHWDLLDTLQLPRRSW